MAGRLMMEMVAGKMMILYQSTVKKRILTFSKQILKCSEISISLPEKVTVVSRGPAAESQPGALGVFSKLPYVAVWENIWNGNFKLLYDGNHIVI